MKRWLLLATLAAAAALALVFTTGAIGGARGLIFDDGAYYQPGSLDDGKDLLPQTTVSLAAANATAQRVAEGGVDASGQGERGDHAECRAEAPSRPAGRGPPPVEHPETPSGGGVRSHGLCPSGS